MKLKNYKPIIVVPGEPNSIFFEIFFKSLKAIRIKNPILVIGSLSLLKKQMVKFKIKYNINILDRNKVFSSTLKRDSINIININYTQRKVFEKISKKSKSYITDIFKLAFTLIKKKYSTKLITGPISKEKFLNRKFLGITEYLAKEFRVKNSAMLIYNKKLSVCPITTHLPLKSVAKSLNKKLIIEKITLINSFYLKNFKFKPNIAILGLNPHCESIYKYNEDDKIIKPAVKILRKKNKRVSGPFSADTIFLKKNRKNFDVIVGMYHDQVLTPLKTLYEYDAINITLGLPFTRVSPDHGPNQEMLGKNISDPLSLTKAFEFLDKH